MHNDTKYGLGDGSYLSDLSFVTSSCSFGIGAKIKVAKNADLNVAYFFTKYEKFNKKYETTAKTGTQEVKNAEHRRVLHVAIKYSVSG